MVSKESADLVSAKPLPFASHFLQVGELRMHYLDEGSGPAVLLLHGNPTWCYYFRRLIPHLSVSFRVIAPDYLGCGLSDHPEDRHFRAVHRIEQLQALLDHLKIQRFSLVMHDWGGPIGTGLALRNLDRLDRMVYLNTTLTETESLPKIIRKAATPIIGKFLTKHSMRFLKLTTDFGVAKKLPRDVRRGYLYPYRTRARRTAIWDFVDDIPFDSTHPTYSEMMKIAEGMTALRNIPVKIIWGLRDPCFHREMLTKVARHFPQAQVIEIPEASHLVLEDAPEIVHPAVKDFLEADREALLESAEFRQDRARIEDGANELYIKFCRMAERQPKSDAVIVPSFFGDSVTYAHTKYGDLALLINKYQRGLRKLGLAAGDRVVVMVPGGLEFLALSYAVMARGAIPVFLDPGMGREQLFRCIHAIAPQVFIGSPKAHLLRFLRKKAFSELKFHITASEWIYLRGPNLSYLKKFASSPMEPGWVNGGWSNGAGLIAYTSGATGNPKGVVFTNSMLRDQLRILEEEYGMKAGLRDLPLLTIFSLFNLANGVCSVFAPIDAGRPLDLDPARVVRVINDTQPDFSFGSPTLWHKIAEYCVRSGTKLSSLKRIFMAGAPVSAHTLQRVRGVVPNGEEYTPYGATEALPVTLVAGSEILDHLPVRANGGEEGIFVGRAVAGVELRVIKICDGIIERIEQIEPLPPREIGEVIVRGANVSRSYFNLPQADQLSKIRDGDSLWHRMGDLGYLDQNGALYYCGRQAHLVTCRGKKFHSVPIENIFNAHAKVRRSALVALDQGTDVGIVIEPHPEFWPDSPGEVETFRREIADLAGRNVLSAPIKQIFFHRSFPVDARHNAKIFRDKLGVWASAQIKSYARGAAVPALESPR